VFHLRVTGEQYFSVLVSENQDINSNTSLLSFFSPSPSLSSYDDLPILAGHGVAALEVLEQMDKLGVEPDAIVIPVGGGGLLAGMTTVIQRLKPYVEIIVSWSIAVPPYHSI